MLNPLYLEVKNQTSCESTPRVTNKKHKFVGVKMQRKFLKLPPSLNMSTCLLRYSIPLCAGRFLLLFTHSTYFDNKRDATMGIQKPDRYNVNCAVGAQRQLTSDGFDSLPTSDRKALKSQQGIVVSLPLLHTFCRDNKDDILVEVKLPSSYPPFMIRDMIPDPRSSGDGSED